MNKNAAVAYAVIILSILVAITTFARETASQPRYGAEGQLPWRIREWIPSCNKGLCENFQLDRPGKQNWHSRSRT
jgi:hypothetical protein